MIGELERIANILKINREGDTNLCLKIQGQVNAIIASNKKLVFTNNLLKQQNDKLKDRINNINKNIDKIKKEKSASPNDAIINTYDIKEKIKDLNKENDIIRTENKLLSAKVRELEKKLYM